MKKTIITALISGTLFVSYGQQRIIGGETNTPKSALLQEAARVRLQSSTESQAKSTQILSNEQLKAKQDVAGAERLRAMSAMQKKQSGKATILEMNQSKEHHAVAPLTPEQNEARIARMNAYKEMQVAREKANTSKLSVQPPSSSPRRSLSQPSRPTSILERGAKSK
ncbi:MAG: hypothetical protein IPP77_15840 [Bacteroidetes bacterium]|nr:hypothetical protein [Bacteroidota bacterium]